MHGLYWRSMDCTGQSTDCSNLCFAHNIYRCLIKRQRHRQAERDGTVGAVR